MYKDNDILIFVQTFRYTFKECYKLVPGPAHDRYIIILELPHIHESLEALPVIGGFNIERSYNILVNSFVVPLALVALLPALVPRF